MMRWGGAGDPMVPTVIVLSAIALVLFITVLVLFAAAIS